MLTLDRLKNPSDAEIDNFDVAEVDLACAAGLPGSERLDAAACLAKLNEWAAWARRYTEGIANNFRDHPEDYDHSPGMFRMIALITVLQKGAGVRYSTDRIDQPWGVGDSRDDFIHGILDGPGGTCASMPVLTVAVGRRLGYPLKLVAGNSHLFARWEEPGGERFNIECSSYGFHSYPDDHYRSWPELLPEEPIPRPRFLRSMTPRDELANAWSKRGYVWSDHGRHHEAVRCFATACSIVTDDPALDFQLFRLTEEWRKKIDAIRPPRSPVLTIYFPPVRRYPGLPIEMERKVIALDVVEAVLTERIPRPGPEVTHLAVRVT